MAKTRPARLDAKETGKILSVSRETVSQFSDYLELLARWTPRINLVGASTMDDPWRRHIVDSGQLFSLLGDNVRTLVDLGSGAGFPGLVLAAMGVPDVHLIESNTRKCAFLREAARALGVAPTVHNQRIEDVVSIAADAVTARGCAPLSRLFGYAAPLLARSHGRALFLKGRRLDRELADAGAAWRFTHTARASQSDPSGRVLIVEEFERA